MAITRGFYRVTMDDLALQAGVSKRTIYRYFESKEAVIEAVVDSFMVRMGKEVDEIIASQKTPEEILAHILGIFSTVGRQIINPLVMQDLRQHYPHHWKRIDTFRMGKAQMIIKAMLAEHNKAYIREIDPRIATTIVLASIQAVLNPEFILANGLSFETAMRQILAFFKHGFIKES